MTKDEKWMKVAINEAKLAMKENEIPVGSVLVLNEKIIAKMRLKRLYINYIIPAIDREIEVDEITGNEVRVVTKGAIVLAIGYSNL